MSAKGVVFVHTPRASLHDPELRQLRKAIGRTILPLKEKADLHWERKKEMWKEWR